MRKTIKAITAAALSLAGLVSLSATADAAEWLSRLRSNGLGKYVDPYVSEDKSGQVRYERSKNDKWSGDYYDSKTGKWTGKKYDGEVKSKSASSKTKGASSKKTKVSAKSSESKSTNQVASTKKGNKLKTVSTATSKKTLKKTALKKSTTTTTAAKPAAKLPSKTEDGNAVPALEKTKTQSVPGSKTKGMVTGQYGPPMPAEMASAQ